MCLLGGVCCVSCVCVCVRPIIVHYVDVRLASCQTQMMMFREVSKWCNVEYSTTGKENTIRMKREEVIVFKSISLWPIQGSYDCFYDEISPHPILRSDWSVSIGLLSLSNMAEPQQNSAMNFSNDTLLNINFDMASNVKCETQFEGM